MVRLQQVKQLLIQLNLYNAVHQISVLTVNRKHLKKLRAEQEFYRTFLEPGDLCFDIGANVGNKTQVFLELGAKVVSVEPQPFLTEILKARFQNNSNFTCVNKGVGEQSGTMKLYTRKNHSGAASFICEWQGEIEKEIEVDITTLDHLVSSYGQPKFCKIDVEGFELFVLKGLSSLIDVISFEYHLQESEMQKTLDCLEHLEKLAAGKIKVNVISSKGNGFLRHNWWDINSFINFFKEDLPQILNFFYGDIFVRKERKNAQIS